MGALRFHLGIFHLAVRGLRWHTQPHVNGQCCTHRSAVDCGADGLRVSGSDPKESDPKEMWQKRRDKRPNVSR